MASLTIGFYSTDAGRSQPIEFLDELEERDRYYIQADLATFAEHGDGAPISIKAVKGKKPMMEIRTGGYRTFFVRLVDRVWVLHICKKQDQRRGIEAAAVRMKRVLGGEHGA